MTSTQTSRLMSKSIPYVSKFIIDKRGDVWERTDAGYRHRLYSFMSMDHPDNISFELQTMIQIADATRIAKGQQYNYWDSS